MRIRDIMAQNGAVGRLDAVNIVSLVLSMANEEVLANPDRPVDSVKGDAIKRLFEERAQGRPLAYIMKKKEFFSEEIYVDERVLIPRPETELLVEEALKIIKKTRKTGRILDMGTGSGAIGTVLAKRTSREIICTDISIEALQVARYNALRMGVSEKIKFLCLDLFGALQKSATFDVIIANLPYVSAAEWGELMEDVKNYEPETALLGGREGAEIYERFTEGLTDCLARSGHVLCEVGGSAQADRVGAMLKAKGLDVISKRDLSGIERVLIGTWINLS